MLKRFEVENFKGFQDRLILDLNARDYIFNKDIVKDGIVKKVLFTDKTLVVKVILVLLFLILFYI